MTTTRRLPRPRVLLALVVGALVAVAAVVVVTARDDHQACGAQRVAGARSPLLDVAGMKQQPDERLDRLAAAVTAMGSPFGAVRAGVGFDYGQYLHLYGVSGGVLAWTRNNAPVTLLDEQTLVPRWSLKPLSRRTAWDTSADRFLLLDLEARSGTRVSSYALVDGKQGWCTDLGIAQTDGDPVATTFLDDGDVLVALKSSNGSGITITRLDGASGRQRWQHPVAGADRADFLGQLDDGLVLVGGIEEYRLSEASTTTADRPAVTAFRPADGATAWTWSPGPAQTAHVVGSAGGRVLVMATGEKGYELVALDEQTGSVRWRVPTLTFESTLRGGVVVTKSVAALVGYSARDGSLLWRLPLRADRTNFPYGFTLGQMPSLDADHVLLPRTTALVVLDVRTGAEVAYPLPVDGVSTTYWPYQLLVTDRLLGVITNTGGILAARE